MPEGVTKDARVALSFEDVRFAYPGTDEEVLRGATAQVPEGAFVVLTGDTGSGKTTLLRLAKREIRPVGSLTGRICAMGADVADMDEHQSARAVGYVFQRPENQIVCDSVWHEMAFGLENLATPRAVMRRRIAETCSYLGMEPWFRAQTDALSGGQRQVLALASVLVMKPSVLLLDEPTSMLDPVAERRFLALLFQLNRDLGVTVVVATHAPERLASYATMHLHLADGRLYELPFDAPAADHACRRHDTPATTAKPVVSVSDAWLRYQRTDEWVLRGLSLQVRQAGVHALVGNNGSGKSTVLATMAGVLRPQRGSVRNECRRSQALLPQDPKVLLSCPSVREELMEWMPPTANATALDQTLATVGLPASLLDRHPYDLSGGQQQLVALGKLLVTEPRLLLLDEPTKGLDKPSRAAVAAVVTKAAREGVAVVLATHDMAFVRQVADTVSLLFDGQVAVTEQIDKYLSHLWLY